MRIKTELKKAAKEIGFDLVGFCNPKIEKEVITKYKKWLKKGFHAGMDYMKRTEDLRLHPDKLLPGVPSPASKEPTSYSTAL